MPKLSIITINYNNAEGLRKTLESVAVQTCHDFEHIIIDGGYTDGKVVDTCGGNMYVPRLFLYRKASPLGIGLFHRACTPQTRKMAYIEINEK